MGLFGIKSKFDVEKIRKDFEILGNGKAGKLVYFDSACMSLRPKQVVSKVLDYYNEYPACAGRSQHKIGKKVEEEIAKAREEVRKFINAKSDSEIIFTRNTTEAINLVANSLSAGWKAGDEVVVSDKEHNSNLIPWLKLQKEKGVKVKVCKGNSDNTFNLDNFKKCLTDKTRLVSVVYVSNLDGVENPVSEIVRVVKSKSKDILVLVDAAQAVPHKDVDVRKLECDFLAFSGHKMCGPSGIGVLYGKKELLEKMQQFLVGGHTVSESYYDKYEEEVLPEKFEAGLQDYAGIVGLGEACRYLRGVGMKKINEHEVKLNKIITSGLSEEIKSGKIELIGPQEPEKRNGIFSFNINGMDVHHVAKILDSSRGIAVRSGAHCVHSWFNAHNLKGSVRASLYLYNTEKEAREFVEEVKKLVRLKK